MKAVHILLISVVLVLMAIFLAVMAVFAEFTNLATWFVASSYGFSQAAVISFLFAAFFLVIGFLAALMERKKP